MRTVQMTLDEELISNVDKIVKTLNTTRSAFTRDALREAIRHIEIQRLEVKHKQWYLSHPTNIKEFSVWETEQEWGDE